MKVTVQVVTIDDNGQESIRELACIEREELTAESLGLSVAESKVLLQSLQEVVVEWQMKTYLDSQRHCPDCGKLRPSKGAHHSAFRTVFGKIPVESPRLEHCPCQEHDTQSFSPLAVLLPEKTTPELLYLETKWASLASYGMSVKMFEDVLPLDEPLQTVTVRNHVLKIAERLEASLGDENGCYIDGCPRDWGELPMPDGPLTVGIDGGYVKAQGMDQGVFEVIAGKSILAFKRDEEESTPSSKTFAFVQTYDEKPRRRLFEVLQSQGMQLNQQIEFLSDRGDDVRDVQLYLSPEADHLLDWFHVTMRITTMTQTRMAKIFKRVNLPAIILPTSSHLRLDFQPFSAHRQDSFEAAEHVEGRRWIGKRCWPMSPDQSTKNSYCETNTSWPKIASYDNRSKAVSGSVTPSARRWLKLG